MVSITPSSDMTIMKVDFEKNLWMDYGAGIGETFIDLVMQMEKGDVGKAVSLFQQKEVIYKTEKFSFLGKNIIKPEQKSAFIIQNIQEIKSFALYWLSSRTG